MPICRYRTAAGESPRLGFITGDAVIDLGANGGPATMTDALNLGGEGLRRAIEQAAGAASVPMTSVSIGAPVDHQEVWAAGVTYLRSRDARMEESTQKSVYDLVYDAERPEIFLKATPSRVSGPGEEIAVRRDSTWDVPEPELAIALGNRGEIIGYTIGNDVSSRSIEGENPLYLPQAKVYNKCAALGPVVALAWEIADPNDLDITLIIRREGNEHFRGQTSSNQIHRKLDHLVDYLFRDNDFPHGAFLMTGTGIIPPSEFTLEHGDEVEIRIAQIGSLVNPVVRLGR